MLNTTRKGLRTVRGKPVLVTILLIAAIYRAASEGFDRLNVALLLNNIGLPSLGRFDPVIWFAVISAGGLLFSLVASEIVCRRFFDCKPGRFARPDTGRTVVGYHRNGNLGARRYRRRRVIPCPGAGTVCTDAEGEAVGNRVVREGAGG